jgi:prophage antirepressor-like protein
MDKRWKNGEKVTMNQMIPFKYEANEIRVIQDEQGEPWWVAKDVCSVLDISNDRMVVSRLDERDVSQSDIIDSTGRMQKTNIINESGLYTLILRSDKPQAKAFQRWITAEVLPAIRKTGTYAALNAKPITIIPLTKEFRAAMEMARAIGFSGNQAVLSANKAVKKITRFNCLELMDAEKLICEVQEIALTASDAGTRLGMSGQQVNKMLQEKGLQDSFRDSKNRLYWSPTEKGKPYAVLKDTGKKHGDGTPVQQLMWMESVLALLDEKKVAVN